MLSWPLVPRAVRTDALGFSRSDLRDELKKTQTKNAKGWTFRAYSTYVTGLHSG